ncbi:metal-sulfur cluster assembly factor [Priestia megaterium]|nr:metal-sulfur cluster assembly factor [Priestia megaterium]
MEKQLEERIMEALEEVVDPELGVDIVNLGLVYGVELQENNTVVVTMTLTSIGCPLAGAITEDVKNKLLPLDGVEQVEVNITFNPPWEKERMSRYAKIALGIQ